MRDEMATFAVAAAPRGAAAADGSAALSIAPEHRASLVSVLVRVLFGRLVQRSSRSGRDSPASRRAAILGYLSGLLPAELGTVVYLAMRPLVLACVASLPPEAAGLSLLRGEEPAAVLALVRRPASSAECAALVATMAAALPLPPHEAAVAAGSSEGGAAALRGLLSGSRAVGVLTLMHDLVRQMGRALVPHLHVLLATVVLLLQETQVQAQAATADGGRLGSRTAEVRGLALLRLHDIMAAHADSYDFAAWLPLVRGALAAALPALPGAMAHAAKPSALLSLLALWAAKPPLRYFLHGIPAAIPAALACLSAGLPGSSEVLRQHSAAVVADPAPGSSGGGASADPARATESTGPSGPVLVAAFAVAASLVGLSSDGSVDDAGVSAEALRHIPFVLQHLAVRLEAATHAPADDALLLRGGPAAAAAPLSAAAPPALRDVFSPSLRVPSLKSGSRAFARLQLALLARVADVLRDPATEAGAVRVLVCT